VKVTPIPTNKPTNADLARGFNELHICHEDTKAKVEDIRNALGIADGKPAAGLSSPARAFWRTTAAVITGGTGLVFVAKLAIIAGPFLWGGLVALFHAIQTGKL